MDSDLSNIRDTGVLYAWNSSKGPLLEELFLILRAADDEFDIKRLRNLIVEGQILSQSAYETRRSIWNNIYRRYFKHGNEWIIQSLRKAAKKGIDSIEFLSLAYLYYVLRDQFTYLFVTNRLWSIWTSKTIVVDISDILNFLENISDTYVEVTHWRESTRKKLALNTLRSLTAFGVLKGKQNKTIQQLTISDEAVFHLLCILWAEGNRGKQIIEAPDWRMFLFNESNVSYSLSKLSMLGWIGFEKSGSTVMIELKRKPEVETDD